MAAYYNEIDPFAAAWLRELIKAGLIADGEVDERSIEDVTADDVQRFTQCHFFAGIGGWSYALRLARWPDDIAVWTGSCPCQPFSRAGYEEGLSDHRDLWPAWRTLVSKCRPAVVFGEQVESAIAHGWADRLFDDLERDGYAVGAVPIPAAGVGTPGERQRLWFVGDAGGTGLEKRECYAGIPSETLGSRQREAVASSGDAPASRLADAYGANAEYWELQRRWRLVQPASDPFTGFWAGAEWLFCDDGKARPVEPGTFPLAYGLSTRVGRLRGYGNAIVPQVAAAFIEAYMSACGVATSEGVTHA